MANSKIEWTESTWNPIAGCRKVSPGCENCYAVRQAYRILNMHPDNKKYIGTVSKTAGGAINWTGQVNTDFDALLIPLKKKKPIKFFVNSMGDMFHKSVPVAFIAEVFAIMFLTPHHTYQLLTKMDDRMKMILNSEIFKSHFYKACNYLYDAHIKPLESELYHYDEVMSMYPLKNVQLGVSIENQKAADTRIPNLLQTPAAVRWLSCEPLLGPVDLTDLTWDGIMFDSLKGIFDLPEIPHPHILGKIDWVVAGGESGPNARPMHPDWARSLRDQCANAGVPFFFKQWGEWAPYFYIRDELQQEIPKKLSSWGTFTTEGFEKKILSVLNTMDVPMLKIGKKKSGRRLDGKLHDEYPEIIK